MKLYLLYIILTPIMPLFTALREYRFITSKGEQPKFKDVLKVHLEYHLEEIKYWEEISNKRKNRP